MKKGGRSGSALRLKSLDELARLRRKSSTRASEQLHLTGFPNRRKATMTVDELRRRQSEREIRNDIIEACRLCPDVVWCARFEAFSGYVMPEASRAMLARALARKASWTPAEIMAEIAKVLAWREFGLEGAGDLILMLRGGWLGSLEVKRPGEKPKPHQEAFLDTVTRHGGCAAAVTSADIAIQRIGTYMLRKRDSR